MKPRHTINPALRSLARHQGGVITHEQAVSLGLTRHILTRLVDDGTWLRLGQGIYFTAHLNPDWEALAWAGVLMAGERSGLSGLSAAYAWGLTPRAPSPISVRMPYESRTRRSQNEWHFERSRQPFRVARTPPRVGLERTVLDLCAEAPEKSSHWVTEAVRTGKTTTARLRTLLADTPRHSGRRQLQALLADVHEGAHSPLELLYMRDVERAHGLPRGVRQVRSGQYRIDVRYRWGLIVELDGELGHQGAGRFRDMRRDNYHQLRGETTLRFGWYDCQAMPCEVAEIVGLLLTQCGWPGSVSACRRCRRARAH